ncbi:MAG: hypothetical protein KDC76_12780, partial [Bacteroidetes bacterium]|nr:hypothetical protein [Bacteroidota bacterium]
MKRGFVLLAILLPCFAFGQWGMQKKWHPMGPFEWPEQGVDSGQWSANGLGWIESLAVFESDPSIMYAGSGTGGLYRTQNGGKTWTFAFDVERVCGVTDIVLDEHNPNHLWVATGTTYWDLDWGLGVLESFNGGRSWVTTGLYFRPEDQKPLWCLKRSSQNPDLFFACSETDIFRSRDGGKNWEVVFDRPDDSRVHFRHLSIHPTNDQRIVASGDYVLTSMDGGTTWEDQSTKLMYRNQLTKTDSLPGRFAHAVNPQHGDQLLVAYSYRYKDYVERSNDFGQTWEVILARSTFNRLDRTHAEIAWHPTDSNVVLIGCVRAFVSEDLGKTFRVSTQPKVDGADYVHDDIRAITITKDGRIYLGNDGGVAVSMDTGRTWSNVSGKGLTVTQFFDIAADYGRLAGGCQDLSSMLW